MMRSEWSRRLSLAAGVLLLAVLWTVPALASTKMVPVPPQPLPGPGPSDAATIRVDDQGRKYVVGELLVRYEDDLSQNGIRKASAPLRRELDLDLEENFDEINVQVLDLGADASREKEDAVVEAITASPEVSGVELNYVSAPATNDPFYAQQWWLPRIGAPAAWGRTTGRVQIAVLDSGVDVNHPDITTEAVTHWYDYLNDTSTAWDYAGHGTHVTGIAAAMTENGIGVAATAPGATVYMAKVCDLYSDGRTWCPSAAAIEALLDLAGSSIPVFNMSLGGYNYSQVYADTIAYAASFGHTIVVSAGNDATNQPSYPAAYPGALSVSATDSQDGDADYSNYGDWVDISAPGGEGEGQNMMVSTYPTHLGSGYQYMAGTSMAAPVVTGVAALLAEQGYSGSALRSKLLATARDIGAAGKDRLFGCGIVDADAATLSSTPSTGCGRTVVQPSDPPITTPVTPVTPVDPGTGTNWRCSAARDRVERAKSNLRLAKSNLRSKKRYAGHSAVRRAKAKVRDAKSKVASGKRLVRIYC